MTKIPEYGTSSLDFGGDINTSGLILFISANSFIFISRSLISSSIFSISYCVSSSI